MDDLFITTSRVSGKEGTGKVRSSAEKTDGERNCEEFQSILGSMVSEQDYRESHLKPAEGQGDSAPSEAAASKQSRSRKEKAEADAVPGESKQSVEPDPATTARTRPQKETLRPSSRTDEGCSTQAPVEEKCLASALGQTAPDSMTTAQVDGSCSVNEVMERIDIIKTLTRGTVPSEDLVRDIVENDGGFLQIFLEGEGQGLQKNKTKDGVPDSIKNLVQNLKHESPVEENHLILAGLSGGESGEHGKQNSEDMANALMLKASKKYSTFAEEKEGAPQKINEKVVDASSRITATQPFQSDVFDVNSLQAKEDNAVFEQGSFSSFLRDRIEKIVEQHSGRNSQADMVVRLKLDDKETILVGLKHTKEKLVVEVKASNEGLVNLLQSHKEDIVRHLEDKNIFTRIYVDPEGGRGFEGRDQRESGTRDGRRKAPSGFEPLLDAIA